MENVEKPDVLPYLEALQPTDPQVCQGLALCLD